MAKDDYYTVVCKILVYLYKKLKGKEKIEPNDYIAPLTDDFPISREYLDYVIEQMINQQFVEKVDITRAWGGDIVLMDYSKMRITPNGIDYLRENSVMRKIINVLPEARTIMELFNI